jgi:hypothetical protein
MSNKLKAITTKAKALYKTGKFDKWTDAIKAASKTISAKATKVVKKQATKAKKYAIKKAKSGVKSLAKKVYESKYLAGTKKAAPKKKATAKNYHKDTNSHNVKLTIMSGIGTYNNPENILMEIEYWQKMLDKLRNEYKSEKGKQYKHSITTDIRLAKKWLELNKQKLKKVITKIK